jgi:hypothetical protein
MAMTVAGISWTLLVLMTRKVHIASVAVPTFLLSLLSSSIALSPSGVAALARPSMFAEMFISIAPIAGWSGGTSGKSLVVTGLRNLERTATIPDCSAIFISPSQRDMMPISPIASSTAIFAYLMMPSLVTALRRTNRTGSIARVQRPEPSVLSVPLMKPSVFRAASISFQNAGVEASTTISAPTFPARPGAGSDESSLTF